MKARFFAFLVLMYIATCTAQRFAEGGNAELVFHYFHNGPSENLSVSIRIRNRSPFFRHGIINNAGLSESQQKRFNVTDKFHNGKVLEVNVKIENVSREDVDIYICDIFRGSEGLQRIQLALAVEFPLGKANCKMVPNFLNTGGIWDVIQCKASAGMDMGWMECYQKGERVPPFSGPVQNTTTLLQDLWIKKNVPVFCCTSSYAFNRDKCNCTDFYLDPVSGGGSISSMVNSDCILQGGDNLISEESITWPPGTTQTNPDSGDQLEPGNDLLAKYLIIQLIAQLIVGLMVFFIVYKILNKKQRKSI